jgi:arylsulfatase A-like enzyme
VFLWFWVGGVAADDLALADPLGAAHLMVRFAVLLVAVAVAWWRGWGSGARRLRRGPVVGRLLGWVMLALLALPLSGALVRMGLPAAGGDGGAVGRVAGAVDGNGVDLVARLRGGSPDRGVRPDLLLLLVDTLRADHLGCYGYEMRPTSPTLDSLAASGVLFESAYAQWTRTAPSHATIFSGLYPHDHGLLANGGRLSERPRLLAEVLREAGYWTVGLVSNPFLGRRYGFDRGFDVYVETADFSLSGSPPAAWLRRLPLVRFWDRWRDQEPVALLAEQWLERHPVSGGAVGGGGAAAGASPPPVALVVQWVDPHMPYRPPPRWRKAFAGGYRGALRGSRAQIDAINAGTLTLDEADVAQMVALYDAEIRNTDDGIGRVLRAWRRSRRGRRTLVALTADHGENMYEHEQPFRHPPEVRESVAHVPWIVSGAAGRGYLPKGVRVAEPVEHVAFGATLLDLLGIQARLGAGGRSEAPMIAEHAVAQALGECPGSGPVEREPRSPGFAVIEAADGSERQVALVAATGWKLRRSVSPRGVEETLWDLQRDPGELGPAVDAAMADSLRGLLDGWFAAQDSSAGALLLQAEPLAADRLDEATIRALRALGYL